MLSNKQEMPFKCSIQPSAFMNLSETFENILLFTFSLKIGSSEMNPPSKGESMERARYPNFTP